VQILCTGSSYSEAEWIRNSILAKNFDSHTVHRLCVDTVVPEKTPQHFPQRPIFTVAALNDGICEKIRCMLQCIKALAPAIQNGAFIVGINVYFSKIVGINIFGMGIYFVLKEKT